LQNFLNLRERIAMNLAKRLLKAGALSPEQLGQALHRQRKFRGFLANHLLDLGLMEPEELGKFVTYYPPGPETLEEIGLPEELLSQLFLKHGFYRFAFSVREMAEALKIPGHLVELLIEDLQQQKFIDISPRSALRTGPDHLAMEIRYILSDLGKKNAAQHLESNSYVGPVPVTIEDYWDWVEAQTIQNVHLEEARLREAFKDYVVPESLFDEIGPAFASGRSVFLFGPSGNGKTVLSRCIAEVFEDPVYIPFALYVHGQIIRVFDESVHQPVAPPEDATAPRRDLRWVWCRRPLVIAGGEMTMAALDPKYSPVSKYYEAPHQILANNGVFILDDFGRQRISPRDLLNRWMYPLESRQDFCSLHTGQQFAVPFDQMVIFCTNLDPAVLADEAFFRRIPHKVFLGYVSPEQYLEIFRRACGQYGLNFDQKVVEEILEHFYFQASPSRPLRACHPRDLIEKLLDRARFFRQVPQLTYQDLALACQSYFIKSMGILDYDETGKEPNP